MPRYAMKKNQNEIQSYAFEVFCVTLIVEQTVCICIKNIQ